jgi:hypothetical protein
MVATRAREEDRRATAAVRDYQTIVWKMGTVIMRALLV